MCASRATASASAVLVTSLLLLAAEAGAQTYKDPQNGFSVKTMPEWNQIPVDPLERTMVAKWASERDIRSLPAQMHVHVFKKRSKPAVDIEGAPNPAGGYDRPEEDDPFNPKSYVSMIRFDPYRRKMKLEDPETFKVDAPEGVSAEGRVYETTRESGSSQLGPYYVVISTVDTPDHQYAVEIFISEKEKRKVRLQLLKIARSLSVIPREVEEAVDTGELTPREQARRRARENAERVPGWWYDETENYFFVTNLPRKKRGFINELKVQMEAIRKVYEKDFPAVKPIDAVSIVRVCESRKAYLDYGGSPSSAGYWNSAAKELVVYAEGDKNDTRATLNHEAFHQYIYYACGELAPHSWFNEGYGDYYAGAKLMGRHVTGIEPFRWRQDLIKAHIREETHVPLKDFIRYSKAQYYSRASLCYAQGWSLIFFFNKALPDEHPWTKILPTYFKVLQETRNAEAAVETAFEGVDLEALEAAWGEFITRGKHVVSR